MKFLLIGGSRFVGPLVIEKLLNRGHNLTVFNRGILRQEYPREARFIKGDRKKGFAPNVRGRFDAVIDMCAYSGDDTERLLKEIEFDFLVHLSTAAVYRRSEVFPLNEESPLGEWPLFGAYNKGKIECELALEKSRRAYASLRPVYILGPKNYLNREQFIYSKIKRGEPLILPGNGSAVIQFVFACEVAEAITLLAEKQAAGVFNCAGDEMITLRGLVKEMAKIVGKEPAIQYNPKADEEKLNIEEFPFANENFIVSNERIRALGIKFVPLREGLRRDYESYYRHVI
jgi:nucleoside-diphosphate-sugar epimerase